LKKNGIYKNSATPLRLKWQTTGIEGEEVQTKGMGNILKKIIVENFPNLEKVMPIQVKDRHNLNRISPQHIIVKTLIPRIRKEY
jgi:hypothetical protein